MTPRTIRIAEAIFWVPFVIEEDGRIYVCTHCLLEHIARMNLQVEEGGSATLHLRMLALNIKGLSEQRQQHTTFYPVQVESPVVRQGEG